MTIQHDTEPLLYHRLARVTGYHGWLRSVTGTLVLLLLGLLGFGLVFGTAQGVGHLRDVPTDADGWPVFGDVIDLAAGLLGTAILLPAVACTVRWIQHRPPGTVSSVVGRLRWRWLGCCLLVTAPAIVVSLAAGTGLHYVVDPGGTRAEDYTWAGWGTFLAGLAVVFCLVPFQAAAEEYVFRGWLLQATGAVLRSPWVVLAPQAFLFAAIHGWGTPWGFADLTVYGVLAGWLTIRTGGIEAAVALHVTNNVIAMGVASAFAGGLAGDETATDLPWSAALVDMAVLFGCTVVILRLARHWNLATHLTPTPNPQPPERPTRLIQPTAHAG